MIKIFSVFIFLVFPAFSWASHSAVVLVYHHIADDTPSSTSISPELFKKQMQYLSENEFRVLPLKIIAKFIAEKTDFPEKVVGISFDDAYESVFTTAYPILKRYDFPFTVFTATSYITDKGNKPYMGWTQLKALQQSGVEIGHHSHRHEHLIFTRQGEAQNEWQKRVRDDITRANELFKERLGFTPVLYAHPYGEFSAPLNEIIESYQMFAFGQQSGAAGHYSDQRAIARFPMSNTFGNLKDFSAKITMGQLPVKDFSPRQVKLDKKPFTLSIKVDESFSLNAFSCYDRRGSPVKVVSVDKIFDYKIESIQFKSSGRHKINCTARDSENRILWYSFLWVVR